jgi:coniferyl-aldehyde dehydrogenase
MTTTTPARPPALLHPAQRLAVAAPTLDQREADLRRLREALKPRLDEMARPSPRTSAIAPTLNRNWPMA